MSRMARAVAAGVVHHVVQRGNRRMKVFFCDADYQAYLDLLLEQGELFGVRFWGYCLMPNHVHLLAIPSKEENLALAIGRAHQAYTRRINFRKKWRGYLWQGRFFSCAMEEAHALRALVYVENNPLRAKLVSQAWQYPWSSAPAHARGKADMLLSPCPLVGPPKEWQAVLQSGVDAPEARAIRRSTRTGRPLGSERFVERLERVLKRTLHPLPPGRKPAKARKRQKGK